MVSKAESFLGFVFLSQPYSLFFSWEFILPTFSLGLLLLFFLPWPYLQFTPLCLKFFRSPIQPIKLPVKSWMEKISSHGLNRPNYSWRFEEKWSMFWGLSKKQIQNLKSGTLKILWWCPSCWPPWNLKLVDPSCTFQQLKTCGMLWQKPTPIKGMLLGISL